jgi:serine beta-lactamase-like protein LACTB
VQLSRRSLLISATATAALASTTRARASSARSLEAARAVVRELLARNPIPALSIAVIRGDELLWAEAFGKADIELDVNASPAHRFRLGSVSKVITATLAAELAARGVIDLDASIAQYLPDLPAQHHTTTMRQLLTHRGGVRHYTPRDESAEAPGPIDRRQYLSNADVLAVFINDPLIATPGELVSYSTFGYTLASVVMEAAARTPFLGLVQRDIATPLGLHSLAGDPPAPLVPGRVSGYLPAEHVKRRFPAFEGDWANAPQNNPAYKWAGGGLLATPTDLARFGAAHLAPGKLQAKTLETVFTVHTERTERSPPLGLGWRIDQDDAQRLRWHHAGGQEGARASLVVYPKEKLSIAFATNVTGLPGDVNGPSQRIAEALLAG